MPSSCCNLSVAVLAVVAGVFLGTPYPKEWGFYYQLSVLEPAMAGVTPAFVHDKRSWQFTFDQLDAVSLEGQHALITGANSGLGFAMAKYFVHRHPELASLTLACRSAEKCNAAIQQLKSNMTTRLSTVIQPLLMDTSSMSSVRQAAQDFAQMQIALQQTEKPKLDMLFLNAGTIYGDGDHRTSCIQKTDEGLEHIFATNHVGHHLLFRWLEPLLREALTGRVVSTSSANSYATYTYKVATDLETLNGCVEPAIKFGMSLAYGQAKLAQILWTKSLGRQLQRNNGSQHMFANVFHPGAVGTSLIEKSFARDTWIYKMIDQLGRPFLWTPDEGALTGLFLGIHSQYLRNNHVSGQYYHPQGQVIQHHKFAENETLQDAVVRFSDELVHEYLPPPIDPAV